MQLAVTEAVNSRHEYVCLEHLLYAMLHDVTTSNILQNSGADLEELKKKLTRYLDEQVERMPKGETVMPRYAIGVQRALQRAALHVQSSGRNEINGGNVLVAMFHETESPAYFFLQEQNVSRFDVINFISHGVSKIAPSRKKMPAAPRRLTAKTKPKAAAVTRTAIAKSRPRRRSRPTPSI